jgi:hypothetical protein
VIAVRIGLCSVSTLLFQAQTWYYSLPGQPVTPFLGLLPRASTTRMEFVSGVAHGARNPGKQEASTGGKTRNPARCGKGDRCRWDWWPPVTKYLFSWPVRTAAIFWAGGSFEQLASSRSIAPSIKAGWAGRIRTSRAYKARIAFSDSTQCGEREMNLRCSRWQQVCCSSRLVVLMPGSSWAVFIR